MTNSSPVSPVDFSMLSSAAAASSDDPFSLFGAYLHSPTLPVSTHDATTSPFISPRVRAASADGPTIGATVVITTDANSAAPTTTAELTRAQSPTSASPPTDAHVVLRSTTSSDTSQSSSRSSSPTSDTPLSPDDGGRKRRRTIRLSTFAERKRARELEQREQDDERQHRWAVIAATQHRVQQLYDEIAAWKEGYRRQQEHTRMLAADLQAATEALYAATRSQQPRLASADSTAGDKWMVSGALARYIGSLVLGRPLGGTALLGMVLIDVMSGYLLDCNNRFIEPMTIPRSKVIGMRPMKPYHQLMSDTEPTNNGSQLRTTSPTSPASVERKVYLRAKQQYPESESQLRALWTGEVERIDVVVRCHMGTAAMYEIRTAFWVQEWTEAETGQTDTRGGQ